MTLPNHTGMITGSPGQGTELPGLGPVPGSGIDFGQNLDVN